MMRLGIAADHEGFDLKARLAKELKESGHDRFKRRLEKIAALERKEKPK
jgi:ribose 5-phosphate isomerase RpiB